MSGADGEDPTKPRVTFDSYVIPETVQEYSAPKQKMRVNSTVLAVSVIAVLTFLLGIMTTLQFVGPRQVVVTQPLQANPANLEQIVSASLAQDVTRQEAPDLLTTAAPVRAEPVEPAISNLQSAVLQGLQPKRTVGKLTKDEQAQKSKEFIEVISRNKLRMLREGVLAGVYKVEAAKDGDKNRLVLTTINAELTTGTMRDLLRQAAEQGVIEIPTSLSTADGDFDMDTMLFNLVQTSLANDGTEEGAEAAREMSRRAFAASSAKTRDVKGERVYVVRPGDSLAYISLQFYGKPSAFERIFQANRQVLSSPDQIQIGQRLIIPG